MRYSPKTKFEIIVSGIFGILYYGALFASAILLIGYAIYKLIIGDFAFFKKEGLLIALFDVFIIIMAIAVIRSGMRDKTKG